MQGKNGLPNPEQCEVVDKIEKELQKKKEEGSEYKGCTIMLDAPAGMGKTFVCETLVSYCNLEENDMLVLCSAYSGVAAQLLPNGMTIHRRFRVTVIFQNEILIFHIFV